MCPYRLLKVVSYPTSVVYHDDGGTELYGLPDEYYIQKSFRLFGFHLFWYNILSYYFTNHDRAIEEMEMLCSYDYFQYKEKWHEENSG